MDKSSEVVGLKGSAWLENGKFEFPGNVRKESVHPVADLLKEGAHKEEFNYLRQQQAIYGFQAPYRLMMEYNLASQSRRLPYTGMQSSHQLLSMLRGDEDHISFNSFPYMISPVSKVDIIGRHAAMDTQY